MILGTDKGTISENPTNVVGPRRLMKSLPLVDR
jgi:hypothetical protein